MHTVLWAWFKINPTKQKNNFMLVLSGFKIVIIKYKLEYSVLLWYEAIMLQKFPSTYLGKYISKDVQEKNMKWE